MATTTISTRSIRVAVVTDGDLEFDPLAGLLSGASDDAFACERVGDPETAAAAMQRGEFEALLVDVRAMDGAGCRFLRQFPRDRVLPIVLLVDRDSAEAHRPVESIPVAELSTRRLDRALRRARRIGAMLYEVRRLRSALRAQAAARENSRAESERQHRLLQGIMQSLPLLIGRLDVCGRVVETHGAGLERCGIWPRALMHRRLTAILPEAREAVLYALSGESAAFSLRGRTNDEEWHADFVVMPETGAEGGAIFLGRDVSERRWLEQQLLAASDAEQQRIGADLHDGLGQQLTGMACLLAALRDRIAAAFGEELAAQADFIVQVANDATRQSRALARGLCPVQLEGITLQLALADLVHQAQQLHGIHCQFRARGTLAPPDHLTAIHLYRITQEALHNAVRHGKARNVSVTLVSRGPCHRLTITDDGCGFDPRHPALAASRGLRLLKYRAGMIGGILSITTHPGRGTRVSCQFTHAPPLHENLH